MNLNFRAILRVSVFLNPLPQYIHKYLMIKERVICTVLISVWPTLFIYKETLKTLVTCAYVIQIRHALVVLDSHVNC